MYCIRPQYSNAENFNFRIIMEFIVINKNAKSVLENEWSRQNVTLPPILK